jgi:hypothetical protein
MSQNAGKQLTVHNQNGSETAFSSGNDQTTNALHLYYARRSTHRRAPLIFRTRGRHVSLARESSRKWGEKTFFDHSNSDLGGETPENSFRSEPRWFQNCIFVRERPHKNYSILVQRQKIYSLTGCGAPCDTRSNIFTSRALRLKALPSRKGSEMALKPEMPHSTVLPSLQGHKSRMCISCAQWLDGATMPPRTELRTAQCWHTGMKSLCLWQPAARRKFRRDHSSLFALRFEALPSRKGSEMAPKPEMPLLTVLPSLQGHKLTRCPRSKKSRMRQLDAAPEVDLPFGAHTHTPQINHHRQEERS